DLRILPDHFTWKFDLLGILNDGNYYIDRYLKAKNYTRDDITEWTLDVQVAYKNHPLATVKCYSSKINGEVTLQDAQKKALSKFELSLSKANFVSGDDVTITLKSKANFNTGEFASGSATTDITFGQSVKVLPNIVIPEPTPDPLVC